MDDITLKGGNRIVEGGRVDTKLDRDRTQDREGHGSSAKATNHVPECSTLPVTPPSHKISQRSIDWHSYSLAGSSSKWSL